jgi:hypothetical protein
MPGMRGAAYIQTRRGFSGGAGLCDYVGLLFLRIMFLLRTYALFMIMGHAGSFPAWNPFTRR